MEPRTSALRRDRRRARRDPGPAALGRGDRRCSRSVAASAAASVLSVAAAALAACVLRPSQHAQAALLLAEAGLVPGLREDASCLSEAALRNITAAGESNLKLVVTRTGAGLVAVSVPVFGPVHLRRVRSRVLEARAHWRRPRGAAGSASLDSKLCPCSSLAPMTDRWHNRARGLCLSVATVDSYSHSVTLTALYTGSTLGPPTSVAAELRAGVDEGPDYVLVSWQAPDTIVPAVGSPLRFDVTSDSLQGDGDATSWSASPACSEGACWIYIDASELEAGRSYLFNVAAVYEAPVGAGVVSSPSAALLIQRA